MDLEVGRVTELEGIIARMRAAEFRSQTTISGQGARAETAASRTMQLEQQVLSLSATALWLSLVLQLHV